ncbi:hypothetical protein [Saccharothrix luteola]|uniref:hypothetical protein n=1 Tax=Saccharothrix luteola TaxID=2893018 RepID=UPI001E3B823E|nr:hypothetical protein [Saccharothrix luteola]MCC8249709.1 hypothetical protein [Saccharothrix luteola]
MFTRTPRLRARMNDPDGGIMDAMFRVFDGIAPVSAETGTDIYVNGIPAGSYAEVTIPPNRITRDDLYPWRVWGSDHGLLTGYVDCEFEVDSRAPDTPVVTSTDYPATGGPHGSVGRTGTFTFNIGTLTGRNNTMDGPSLRLVPQRRHRHHALGRRAVVRRHGDGAGHPDEGRAEHVVRDGVRPRRQPVDGRRGLRLQRRGRASFPGMVSAPSAMRAGLECRDHPAGSVPPRAGGRPRWSGPCSTPPCRT